MKNIFRISGVILLILSIFLIHSCKKKEEVPVITTTAVTVITQITATSGGNVTSDGGATVTARGVCWSTTTGPTIALSTKTTEGTGTGIFTSSITALTAGTVYYVRAYATNSAGTAYGQQIQFTSLVDYSGHTGTLNDIDGNTYPTIGIGSQIWMAENLKTTKFNDGTAIQLVTVTEGSLWAAPNTLGYCWYNDAAANKVSYGALYNWYTVHTIKLCPKGWHVPSREEWHTLILDLDPSATTNVHESFLAGTKLKETGTAHWYGLYEATNESGFTALPGGERDFNGTYYELRGSGFWWTSTENTGSSNGAWYVRIDDSGTVDTGLSDNRNGYSVRCLMD